MENGDSSLLSLTALSDNCPILFIHFMFLVACFHLFPISRKDALITLRMKSCLTLALPRSPCHRHLPVRQLRRPCLYGIKNDEQLSVFREREPKTMEDARGESKQSLSCQRRHRQRAVQGPGFRTASGAQSDLWQNFPLVN